MNKKKKKLVQLNLYKKIVAKRRTLKRSRLEIKKKYFYGPRPRMFENYKFHKWKYNFIYKQKQLKEKNQWFSYLLMFRKYYSYRYCLNHEVVTYFKHLFVKKKKKLLLFSRSLESRLSSLLVRSGCVWNYVEANWLVKNNYISVNSIKCNSDRFLLKPQDSIQIIYWEIKNEKYKFLRYLHTYKVIFKANAQKYRLFIFKTFLTWNTTLNYLQVSYFRSRLILVSPIIKFSRTMYCFYTFLFLYY